MENYDELRIITKKIHPWTTESESATVSCWGSCVHLLLLVGEPVWVGLPARCRHRPRTLSVAAMAQVDDVLFGKGKREQYFKMKTEGVRTSLLAVGCAAAAGCGEWDSSRATSRPLIPSAGCSLCDTIGSTPTLSATRAPTGSAPQVGLYPQPLRL